VHAGTVDAPLGGDLTFEIVNVIVVQRLDDVVTMSLVTMALPPRKSIVGGRLPPSLSLGHSPRQIAGCS
jgi:hypothetical protein